MCCRHAASGLNVVGINRKVKPPACAVRRWPRTVRTPQPRSSASRRLLNRGQMQHIKHIGHTLLGLIFLLCLYSPVVMACSGKGVAQLVLYNRLVVLFCAGVSAGLTLISITLFFLTNKKEGRGVLFPLSFF